MKVFLIRGLGHSCISEKKRNIFLDFRQMSPLSQSKQQEVTLGWKQQRHIFGYNAA